MGRILFKIDPELIDSVMGRGGHDMRATFADLVEMDLVRPPAPDFDIDCRTRGNHYLHRGVVWLGGGRFTSSRGSILLSSDYRTAEDGNAALGAAIAVLLCALATRNVVKKVRTSKLAKLGIGKRSQYDTVVTLKVPQISAQYDASGTSGGRAVRAHFRRGFIRRQRYGPRNEQEKKVWIAPVFVNADEDFVAPDRTYRLVA